MESIAEHFKRLNSLGHPCCYHGDHEDWLIVIGQSRDSRVLEQSNYRSTLKALQAICTEGVIEERAGHWAVGWIDTIIIDPKNPALKKEAQSILDALTDYPIVDDEDHSNLEYEEASKYWDHLNPRERMREAKETLKRIHWLKPNNLIRYSRMSYHTLGNDDSDLSRYMYERCREGL